MSDHQNPRPMGFVSSMSDTDVHDKHEKSHNPISQAAHYLKNAVTLESKSDEKRRESAIADHAHVNHHGGHAAENKFWDQHAEAGTHGHGQVHHGGVGGGVAHEETRHEIKQHAKEAHGHDGKARGNVVGTMM